MWPKIEAHLGLEPGALGDTVTSPMDEQLLVVQAQIAELAATMQAQLDRLDDKIESLVERLADAMSGVVRGMIEDLEAKTPVD